MPHFGSSTFTDLLTEWDLSESALDTEGEAVKYWTRPDTFTESYEEGAGGTSSIEVVIHGDDAADFLKYASGFTRRDESMTGDVFLKRFLPLQSPYDPKQRLKKITLATKGPAASDPFFEEWPSWEWLHYKLEFETRSYVLLEDIQTPAFDEDPTTNLRNELYRYTTRVHRLNARERKVPKYQIEAVGYGVISEVGFIVDRVFEWAYTWHQIPFEAYPAGAIAVCSGKVNEGLFDSGPDLGQAIGAEKLLFRGLANEVVPYYGRDGELYVDVTYLFAERYDSTWNQYVPPGESPVALRYVGTTTPLYAKANFNDLFKPQ